MPKNDMNRYFIYTIEPWKRPLLVVVGCSMDDIAAISSVFQKTEKVIEDVKADPPMHGDEAAHWQKDGETILWLESWENDDEHKATLLHETNHIIYYLSRYVGFQDEPEAQAYTQENIWTDIVKRLNS
jgi:hypothetical protein